MQRTVVGTSDLIGNKIVEKVIKIGSIKSNKVFKEPESGKFLRKTSATDWWCLIKLRYIKLNIQKL